MRLRWRFAADGARRCVAFPATAADASLGAVAVAGSPASSPALAWRIEFRSRRSVAVLSVMIENLGNQRIDLGSRIGAAATGLKNGAAFEHAVPVYGAASQCCGGNR